MVQADAITATNGASISTFNDGEGASGNIAVTAERIELEDAFISSSVAASGEGGEIMVQANDITATNEASISTFNNGEGASGNIAVTAERIELDTAATIDSFVIASGDGGEIRVQAGDIVATNEASISTANNGEGASGDVSVTAERIELDTEASITSLVSASGDGGNVKVQSTDILIANRANINTFTIGSADAGNINLQADNRIELQSEGVIGSSSSSNGDSGSIFLTAGEVLLQDSRIDAGSVAEEEVPNAAEAVAGIIDITADSVSLDESAIATTSNFGTGGEIFVDADDFLLLRNGSLISTTAGELTATGGDGGNIEINTPFVVGVLSENSDITANAFEGNGGRVFISALDILGLEFQDELTPFSDITASSADGNAGITEFDRLTDIEPENGLNELPVDLADPTSLISRQCALQASDNASEFTVVGRGGLPPDPSQPGAATALLEDLGTIPTESDATMDQLRINDDETTGQVEEIEPLITVREAQGGVKDENGLVHLVATLPESNETTSLMSTNCQ